MYIGIETISTQKDPNNIRLPRASDEIGGVVVEEERISMLHREKTTPSSRTTNDKGAASHAQTRWTKSSEDGRGLRRPNTTKALLIMVTLGTLIGLIPAQRAVSIKPIDALREE